MKTILAHWKKDLVSSRALFTAWAACVALILLFAVIRLTVPHLPVNLIQPDSNGFPKALALFFGLMTGLIGVIGIQFVLLALLVVRIIHLDPLVDPDAFWRTRPISGAVLLAAKSLFVAILLFGAVLCLAVMRFNETTIFSSFLSVAVFIIGVFAFASLTSGLSSMILNWLGIVVLAGVFARAFLAVGQNALVSLQGSSLTMNLSGDLATGGHASSLWPSVLYLAGFVAAILCQYLARRTNLSRAILFATFFLVTLLQGWR